MTTLEGAVRLGDVKDERVVDLLKRTRILHYFFGMDMKNARWVPRGIASMLFVEARVSSRLQGWMHIIHGGAEDFFIHDAAGIAALAYSRSSNQRDIVLGKDIWVGYSHPLPLKTPVQIVASIESHEGEYITTSARIQSLVSGGGDPTVYARGTLRVKQVDQARLDSFR